MTSIKEHFVKCAKEDIERREAGFAKMLSMMKEDLKKAEEMSEEEFMKVFYDKAKGDIGLIQQLVGRFVTPPMPGIPTQPA